jgi:hypothetical protein
LPSQLTTPEPGQESLLPMVSSSAGVHAAIGPTKRQLSIICRNTQLSAQKPSRKRRESLDLIARGRPTGSDDCSAKGRQSEMIGVRSMAGWRTWSFRAICLLQARPIGRNVMGAPVLEGAARSSGSSQTTRKLSAFAGTRSVTDQTADRLRAAGFAQVPPPSKGARSLE